MYFSASRREDTVSKSSSTLASLRYRGNVFKKPLRCNERLPNITRVESLYTSYLEFRTMDTVRKPSDSILLALICSVSG
jgi:hypothetical protein